MGLFERRRLEREEAEAARSRALEKAMGPEDPSVPDTEQLVIDLKRNNLFQPNPPLLVPVAMGKLQYAKWLNDNVYRDFAKGTLVTFKTLPLVLDTVPPVYFVVSDIQEMHYWATVDRHTREPKAVGLRMVGGKSDM